MAVKFSKEVRFNRLINKRGPFPSKVAIGQYPEIAGTRCWLFTGTINVYGYGHFQHNLKLERAHKVAWELKHGKIPVVNNKKKQLCVLHKCDVRNCVRTSHEFLGTRKDNNRDCQSKGRKAVLRGEQGGNAKLSDKDVAKIRRMFATGKYLYKDLAPIFDVSYVTISAIVRKRYR